jgi:GNAT superfamily N-acetyltransferase
MDGNTWRPYRHVTEPGVEPAFFLEPTNPPDFPLAFSNAGFSPLAQYYSAVATDLTHRDPRMEVVGQRLDAAGITIRTFDPTRFDAEAARIYELSRVAFARNFLYTPIPREEFLAHYAAVRTVVRPELCLLAEQQGRLVGFLFALPDMCQRARGHAIDTVVVKTVAALPGRDNAGLGSYLVEQVQLRAHDLGYRRAIHALMHESNKSRNLSAHYARTMRRYTLFSKRLAQGSTA